MARFKPVGKKRTKKMAPVKQGQDNMCSSSQVVADSAGASSGAATGTASPVNAPANSDSAPFTADAATTEMQPIRQSSCAAAQTAKAILRYVLYQFMYTNLYLLCFCMNSYIQLYLCEFI
jgi:hypothetical protein